MLTPGHQRERRRHQLVSQALELFKRLVPALVVLVFRVVLVAALLHLSWLGGLVIPVAHLARGAFPQPGSAPALC